jgi:hypothetical protein
MAGELRIGKHSAFLPGAEGCEENVLATAIVEALNPESLSHKVSHWLPPNA